LSYCPARLYPPDRDYDFGLLLYFIAALTLDVSIKDDITVILLLGVSFM
jgi:hypothetical protein